MPVFEFEGRRPTIGDGTYIYPDAVIIGDVRIGEKCFIGPGVVIRAEHGTIFIGNECAIEDGVFMHVQAGKEMRIGSRVIVGHKAMLHNCTIQDEATIGMCSTISDLSVVGAWSIIAEMSLVKKSQIIPPNVIAGGVPAEVIRELEERHKKFSIWGKDYYVGLAQKYPKSLKEIS